VWGGNKGAHDFSRQWGANDVEQEGPMSEYYFAGIDAMRKKNNPLHNTVEIQH
jgi:hypothetical protein